MPKVFLDKIETLNYTERLGVIRNMTRKARVVYGRGDTIKTDYSALKAAMELIDGPPFSLVPFSDLSALGHSSLVLIERSPSIAENDVGCVDILLKYEHVLDGANQELLAPRKGMIFGKGKCSIAEKTTNFYRPYGNPNAERIQIQTAHTYDRRSEPSIAGMPMLHQKTNPMTIYQGGEVSIPFPQSNFQLQGVITTLNPFATGDEYIACINDRDWLGKPKFTWICSEVSWDILDIVQSLYKFTFEFQYNVDTWNPTVVFNDHRTGRPPPDVQPGIVTENGTAAPTVLGLPPILSYRFNQYTLGQALGPGSPDNPNSPGTAPYLQPAGYWTVPALKPKNFHTFFGGLMEGFT